MKALIIAPQPFFSPRGTPFSVYYRTLVTAELGVTVDLLTYGEGQDVDIPGVRIIRIPRFAFLGDVKIGPSYLKLFLDFFITIWTIKLILTNKYDFVHAHEEAVFICRFLKPLFRFKMVYDMHSSLPQQLTNFQFSRSKTLIKIFKKLEDTSLRASDAIITICPDLADYVNSNIKDREKHILIENSIFEEVKVSRDDESPAFPIFRPQAGELPVEIPKEKRSVVYAGTLEPYQGIDILIDAFKKVVEETGDVLLLIIGGKQGQVEHYKALAREKGIEDRVIFTGLVPQQVARHYNNNASVLVSPRSDGTNTPLKIYEYLASGIPIVATDIYSHTQVLSGEVAFLVKPDAEDMTRGILRALGDGRESAEKAAEAKKMYDEHYSRPVYEAKMRHLLEILS